MSASDVNKPQPWLRCSVGGLAVALPLARVREILRAPAIQPVALTPPLLRGLITLRGTPILVVDLARRLGTSPAPEGRHSSVILVSAEMVGPEGSSADATGHAGVDTGVGTPVGVWVDRVHEIASLAPAAADAVPSFGSVLSARHVACMLRQDGQWVYGLALSEVLNVPAIAAQVASHARSACGSRLAALGDPA